MSVVINWCINCIFMISGKSTCTIVTFGKWEWFENWENEQVRSRGGEYDSIKNTFSRRMWEQVLTLYPQLRDKVRKSKVTN